MIKDMLMKEVLIDFLRQEMINGDKVMLLEADLAKCSGGISLMKEFPERAINVGIAEQNMASVAAGLSAYGYIPFIHTFAPFATRRICDQVMISICYAKQNVKIIGSDPGIAAELNGGTHMPFEDIGVLRSIPGMVIYEPTDNVEFKAALPQILNHNGAVYLRLFRKTPPAVYEEDYKFDLFKANVYKEGSDVSIMACGLMVDTAIKAVKELEKLGVNAELVIIPTIKPIDRETIIASAKKTRAVVTAENHNIIGGLRSAVSEVLSEECPTVIKAIGAKDRFGEVGKMPYLRKALEMDVEHIVEAAKAAIAAKG